jgi:hypothetical protein
VLVSVTTPLAAAGASVIILSLWVVAVLQQQWSSQNNAKTAEKTKYPATQYNHNPPKTNAST